uniref:Uncharacterized protein n=1 Tax=Anguilla anguilla TaxID=7936 RepID=A0A0E9WHE5_ANGAN
MDSNKNTGPHQPKSGKNTGIFNYSIEAEDD